jgi:hypothetical protein
MAGTGSATLNFGAAPGTNVVSVAVTGETGISGTSHCEAFIMQEDSTADHTQYEHMIAPITLRCGGVVAGTGFTIYGWSEHRLTGTFDVRWVWAD